MNRRVSTIILITFLTLFLGVIGVIGQEPPPEGGGKSEGDVSDAAMVNSYISYQGKLTEDGSPVTGERDMTFRLYSDAACSIQVGSNIVMPGVTVTEGLFSAKLAVDQSHFSGQGLWLGVDVGNTGTNILCEEILPAPYALSLRPGAVISDTQSYVKLNHYKAEGFPQKFGVYAIVNGPPYSCGVYGSSANGWGVRGESDLGWGVVGRSNSNIGVYGFSESSYGVYAVTDDSEAAGIYALGEGEGADIILGGDSISDDGKIYSDPRYSSSDIYLVSNDGVRVDLDIDGDGEDADFEVRDKDGNLIFNVDDGGTTRVNVLQIAGGADLAEPFEVAGAESVVPGMVVAIDPEHVGQLRVADTAYDRTVAGCVSGANGINPGLTMQQEGTVAEGSLPVALSGRVYCWADASAEPIQPGDLLTTSDTPGHAMKVLDHERAQGAILGKAMSPLDEGTGLVLVLVTLQ